MLRNCCVTSAKAHVADLAFAEVFEDAVSPIAVGVPMLESFFACDDDYQWVLCRRNNSSLLLSAKARVNVEPPIVNAANLKAPGHLLPPDFEIERMLV